VKLNRAYETGDVVEVGPAVAGAGLPVGLAAGFQVRVIQMTESGDVVERDGREWRVPYHQLRPRSDGRRR